MFKEIDNTDHYVATLTNKELLALKFFLSILDLDKIHYILNNSSMKVNIDGTNYATKILNEFYNTFNESRTTEELLEELKSEIKDKTKFEYKIEVTEEEAKALTIVLGELSDSMLNNVIKMNIDIEIEVIEELGKITDDIYNCITDDLFSHIDCLELSEVIAEEFIEKGGRL